MHTLTYKQITIAKELGQIANKKKNKQIILIKNKEKGEKFVQYSNSCSIVVVLLLSIFITKKEEKFINYLYSRVCVFVWLDGIQKNRQKLKNLNLHKIEKMLVSIFFN